MIKLTTTPRGKKIGIGKPLPERRASPEASDGAKKSTKVMIFTDTAINSSG